MPSQKDAAWWREHRAAKKAVEPPAETPTWKDARRYIPPEGSTSTYQYLPGDELIGEMSQRARDRILARINGR